MKKTILRTLLTGATAVLLVGCVESKKEERIEENLERVEERSDELVERVDESEVRPGAAARVRSTAAPGRP